MKTLLLFSLILFFSACSHLEMKIKGKPTSSGKLFPVGNYQQKVKVKWDKNKDPLEFNGVLSLRQKTLLIVGLSPFQSTIFQLQDSLSEPSTPTVNIYVDELKKFKGNIVFLYSNLKPLMKADKNGKTDGYDVVKKDLKGRPMLMKSKKGNVTINIVKFGEHNLPEKFILQFPKWGAEIRNTSYEN